MPQNILYAFDVLVSFGICSNNDFEFDPSNNIAIYQFDHAILTPPNLNANMFLNKGVGTPIVINHVNLDFVL